MSPPPSICVIILSATTNIDLPGFFHSALKTGGEEILRERWDEAQSRAPDTGDTITPVTTSLGKKIGMALPDWTRGPLLVGAPYAGIRRPVDHQAPPIQQELIGV